MSYKEVTIYTPEGTQPHIAAEDDAFIYNSLFGGRSGLLGDMNCEKVNNNTVRLSAGGVCNKGYVMYVPYGCTHDLPVQNGSQGLKRHDLVVARFTRGGGSQADTHAFAVVRGEAAVSPGDPELTAGELSGSGNVNELALFRVVLDGLEITAIEKLAYDIGNPGLAQRLAVQRNISLTGDASGSAVFDGSANANIPVSVNRLCGSPVTISQSAPQDPCAGDLWICYGV